MVLRLILSLLANIDWPRPHPYTLTRASTI
jgi:hypothetical protein